MRFRVLGAVQASDDDAGVAIPGERVRTLLAALLLRPDQVVADEQLLYDVWGEELPSNPRAAMQAAISRLRRSLTNVELRNELGGYRLILTGHELDLTRFRDGVAEAVAADPERRVELLSEALRWHAGDVLRGASTGTLAERFGRGLRDEWLDARERRAEARLLIGRVDEALAELTEVTADSPLREQAWLLLLKGLHQAGRTAEALAAYDRVRQVLAEELGTDPSPELRELHQVLLAGDRPGAWTARTRLPLPVTGFIGRDDELTKALDLLANDNGLPVLVLSGLGGVGKSALAVRIGHAAKHLFPDGQWLVRVRDRAVDDVLAELLGFCGVGSDAIPSDPHARVEMFREALTGRRVLLILDDAPSVDHVHGVLPNAAGSAVIVTSRRSLRELAVTVGASGTVLEPLSARESKAFLRRAVGGAPGVDGEATDELAGLCAGLPLALRIAAAGARTLPAGRLAAYAGQLRADRLDRLSRAVGDHGVRESFTLSYDALPSELRRLFGLLGMHPGDEFGIGVAAALLGADAGTTAAGLDQLAEASLLIRTDVDRYRFHDLVRDYAAGLDVDGREQAARRMLDWYLYSGLAAMEALYAGDAAQYLDPIGPDVEPDRPRGERDAYDWFDTEWDSLVAAVRWAGTHGHGDRSWQLVGVTWPYVGHRRRWQDHRSLFSFAAGLAHQQERADCEAWVLGRLGYAQVYAKDLPGARASFVQMRRLSRTAGDRHGEASALRGEALVSHVKNCEAEALGLYLTALELEDVPIGRAHTLNNLGDCQFRLGALDDARATVAEAVRIYRNEGSRQGGALAGGTLAEICLAQGDLEGAEQHVVASLAVFRELRSVVLEAEATSILALIHEAAQDQELARRTAGHAANLLRDAGANTFVARIAHLAE
ncbi:NB-ARC domain-containing protein [Kribbella sp. NBC_00709]|uniref:AfsR/SARP family transcriptional regulator n=1 Tax=Kribbella sp. NBC_00709 TaxID=2975972 RepID=UPI002E2A9DB3|nr:BTAD domain-containing putative transcriptional regulator [Kribbella sp. NBC_00709]